MKKELRALENAFHRAGNIRPDNKDPRRHQELVDFNMINEDHRAMANLPESPKYQEFPKQGGYFMPMWD